MEDGDEVVEPIEPESEDIVNLTKRLGVDLVLESNDDWKIQEIGFDGVERYLQPETFTDHVGKLARKVEWTKLVGTKSPYENSKVDPEDELDDENVAKGGLNEELVTPEAGPWSSVAKYLHESLNQLNSLLDVISVTKSTDYMKALTVLDPITVQEPTPETISTNRGTQWIWKRRALQEAVQVLDMAQKQRQRASSNLGLSADYMAHLQRTKFFEELREMREIWRVRKVGDYICGDLSYHIFGWKYDTPAIFDISRRSLSNNMENLSIIEVSVPKDLARRSMLAVSIVQDDIQSGNGLFRDPKDKKYTYSYRESDSEKVKLLHWKDSLKWAQNTLLLRDVFKTICTDAIKLRNRLSIIRDNVLLIHLFDDYLLRFELQWFPFQTGEIKEEGDIYLNRVLREMIIGFECTKFIRPQFFCSMPVTHLPEALDLRGCGGFNTAQIEERAVRSRSILQRMLDVASHRALVTMVSDVAERVSRISLDPTVQYRWLNCGRTTSRMMFNMTSKDFEMYIGTVRSVFFANISSDGVEVETKDGIKMKCQRDPARVMYACQYAMCCYSVTMVSTMSRNNNWVTPFQTMCANVFALDERGNPAPNIVLCNQAATRSILFVFHVGMEPEVFVRRFIVNEETMKPEEHEWKKLCYSRLHGATLCRKIDALLVFLRDH
ncbi:Mediator of RNA polymerase II transcription subunit 17 [Caenorhabditis elegans]|uniref:Isoform a of Mediator of RNA polymerase II transcription subunit 17 n=1 Tax=Caenorhabditis elegans TaxID=6239 RepID=Q9NAL4-2|nr:Mediator of RNA polymerase II transcription subunit 17 [Caenorhabditis elegans]CCD31130.1 Mediator of RNA polymerase II transcription subunit 17 [Caenorhabditis elegans]|eukprot:NP_001256909.1 Mediator of RNA polymerase II transcription subunit 17 [Caenorhabditis elegans]